MLSPQELGRQYERDFAKRFGGKVVPGSGNQWHSKLDVNGKCFLFSLKHTTHQSFRVEVGMLEETARAVDAPGGRGSGITPAMSVMVGGEEYIVLRSNDFFQMIQEDVKVVRPSKKTEKTARAATPKLLRGSDEEEDNV